MDDVTLPMWFAENGAVWHRQTHRQRDGSVVERGRRRICDEGTEVALAYDTQSGMAHKFGTRDVVEEYVAQVNAARAASGVEPGVGDIAIVSFIATPVTVAEALACWERTGSALEFAGRYGQSEDAAPSLRH